MNTSWKRCLAFGNLVNGFILPDGKPAPGWLARHPQKTKFHYAIKRVMDQLMKQNEAQLEAFENLEIDKAATGKHGELLYNPDGSYAMTPEKMKEFKAERKTLAEKEITIEPHFAQIPDDLTEGELDIFEGFVISKEDAEKYREKLYEEPKKLAAA